MRKVPIVLFLITTLLSCNNSKKENTSKVTKSDAFDKSTQNKNSNLKGLWVNVEYIDTMKKNMSVCQTESSVNFWISILIKGNNTVEAMVTNSFEPTVGQILENKLMLVDSTYTVDKMSENSIQIKDFNGVHYFTQLDSLIYKDSYDGIDYLRSFIYFGSYKFIDPYQNQKFEITLNGKNQLIGFPNCDNFSSFCFSGNEVLSFLNQKNEGRYFIIKRTSKECILKEIEIIDMEEGPINPTGKEYILERK